MSYSTTTSTATLRSKVAGPLLVYVFRRPVHCRALFPLWGRMAVLILHSLSTLYWDTSAPARKRRRRYITVYSVSLHTPVQRYPTSPWEVPPILGGGADLKFEVPKQFQIAPPFSHSLQGGILDFLTRFCPTGSSLCITDRRRYVQRDVHI